MEQIEAAVNYMVTITLTREYTTAWMNGTEVKELLDTLRWHEDVEIHDDGEIYYVPFGQITKVVFRRMG